MVREPKRMAKRTDGTGEGQNGQTASGELGSMH